MTLFVAALTLALPPVAIQSSQEDWLTVAGVRSLTVNLPEGTVQIYLPLRIVGGEMISGSVFARPKPGSSLEGFTLRILDRTVAVNGQGFTVPIPGSSDRLTLSIDRAGAPAAEATIPLLGGAYAPHAMSVSPVATVGGALYVSGPFDGNRANTQLQVDGQAVGSLCESARGCAVSILGRSIGSHTVRIGEGLLNLEAKFNVLQVRVVAPGTRLKKGKQALDVVVDGLEGLPESAFPLGVSIANETPNILKMLDLETLVVGSRTSESSLGVLSVPFAEVKNGSWTGKLKVQALRVGEFRLTSYAYSKPFVKSSLP